MEEFVYIVVRKMLQHLKYTRDFMKAELNKLDSRAKYLEGVHIRRVLNENMGHFSEQRRMAEIWRRLGADGDYKLVKERRSSIKSELARISREIESLSKSLNVSAFNM